MAKSLAHTVISLDQSAALQLNLEQSEVGTQQFRTTLASYLNLSLADIDAKNDVLLDYHFYNMVFAKKNGFTPLKTSAFLGIMKALLDEDVNAEHRDVRQSFFRLKELLLEHSVERPPWSVGIFEEADIDPILTYATNNYFRHFRLYRMCMAPRVQMELKQHNPGFIELPAPSRPLSAAVEIFGKVFENERCPVCCCCCRCCCCGATSCVCVVVGLQRCPGVGAVFSNPTTLFYLCAGEVDEMQLSEKELLLVEKEVEKRMIPVRQDFEQERTKYQEILNKVEDEEEEKVEEKGGKKKRK